MGVPREGHKGTLSLEWASKQQSFLWLGLPLGGQEEGVSGSSPSRGGAGQSPPEKGSLMHLPRLNEESGGGKGTEVGLGRIPLTGFGLERKEVLILGWVEKCLKRVHKSTPELQLVTN